jgi:glycosyltransferase involved in cell wall biosynthesis
MLPALKDLSRALNVEDRIHWLGNVTDPRPLLQASDIFLLASIGEAFGLVLTEAMACGVPVIGTRSGSLPEVVEEGKTGLLVSPNDAKGFAAAIESLGEDQELRRAMGREACVRVRQLFTIQQAVANTILIYRNLTNTVN